MQQAEILCLSLAKIAAGQPGRRQRPNYFYYTQNTAIGKFTEAQLAMAEFDISAASSANSSAPVISSVEQKQQRVNTLTLKYMDDRHYQFSSTEKAELQNMANECLAKGDYVTHARNLVDVFMHTPVLYDDECEAESNNSRKKQITIPLTQTVFNLFPNPNNGTMQLDYNLGGYSAAKFNLFDITGKLIQSKNIENTEGSLYINEQNLKNGVYFYTILVGEKNIKTDKIVIIK
ncbi:MAG: T9SS type A sorting domain-containing protein [Bacteroidota bacterium]